ncbi:MAG: hypothetical protein WC965_01210 [Thiohalomonadaceae bacterium]
MIKVCITCGAEFEHVQGGRGRPPKSCKPCREGFKKPPEKKEEPYTTEKYFVPGIPKVGDYVMHTAFDARWATPVKLASVEGNKAVVLNGDQYMETYLDKLSLFAKRKVPLDTLVA